MKQTLPAAERVAINSARLENLWKGAGDYDEKSRPLAIVETSDALEKALTDLHRENLPRT